MNTQQDFLNKANEWCNIFLTGNAWTGKTYVLKQFIEEQKNNKKHIIVVAPTGIAAINAWGATIHSTFKLFWDNYSFIPNQKIKWNEIDILIIDEISMVSCDLFDFICKVIWKFNPTIQIICIWDLAQLPPIYNLKNELTNKRYNELMNTKWSVLFNVSDSYSSLWFIEINLTEQQRCKDEKYVSLLNRIRQWDLICLKDFKHEWYSTQFWNKAIHIFPYNNQVDEYNYSQLLKLHWKQEIFVWEIVGNFNMNNVLVSEELRLKIWARIMIVKNLDCWLVNWDMWDVISINRDESIITIFSDRLQKNIDIWISRWDNTEYNEHWEPTILGSLYHFPLKLSYWITSHKIQGMTLDKVIFHYNKNLSKELIYVACSRCTSYDNFYIVK